MAEDPQQHAIRLNGAWELRCLPHWPNDHASLSALAGAVDTVGRVNLPCAEPVDRSTADDTVLLLTRRFNRPSNLSPGQPITLLIEGLPADAALYFNGAAMEVGAHHATTKLPIGQRLADNNRLDLVLRSDAFLRQGSVRLVITDAGGRSSC